jgi:hypothetical protein
MDSNFRSLERGTRATGAAPSKVGRVTWDRRFESGLAPARSHKRTIRLPRAALLLSTGMSPQCGEDTLSPGPDSASVVLPRPGNRPRTPKPDGPPESTNLAKYQQLAALMKQGVLGLIPLMLTIIPAWQSGDLRHRSLAVMRGMQCRSSRSVENGEIRGWGLANPQR